MQLGAQLFGICANSILPLPELMRALADAGYTSVEPCVAMEPIPGWERSIWPMADFEALAEVIRDCGMTIPSCHLFAPDLAGAVDTLDRLTKTYGIKAYVVKPPRDLSPESLESTGTLYKAVSEKLKAFGAELLIHNEAAEIRLTVGEGTAYDALLSLSGAWVGSELDIGWYYAAGRDPMAFMKSNPGLVRMIHYKDFAAAGEEPKEVPVGTGAVDTAAFVRAAMREGIPQIVDQDTYEGDVVEELRKVKARLEAWAE